MSTDLDAAIARLQALPYQVTVTTGGDVLNLGVIIAGLAAERDELRRRIEVLRFGRYMAGGSYGTNDCDQCDPNALEMGMDKYMDFLRRRLASRSFPKVDAMTIPRRLRWWERIIVRFRPEVEERYSRGTYKIGSVTNTTFQVEP